MSITNIQLFSIPVSDPERSKTFYTDCLGFRVVSDTQMGPDSRWIQLAPGNGGTSIALVTWFP